MTLNLDWGFFLLTVVHSAREFTAIGALLGAILCFFIASRRFDDRRWYIFYWFIWVIWIISIIGLAAPIFIPTIPKVTIIPGGNLIVQIILGIAAGVLIGAVIYHRPVINDRFIPHYRPRSGQK